MECSKERLGRGGAGGGGDIRGRGGQEQGGGGGCPMTFVPYTTSSPTLLPHPPHHLLGKAQVLVATALEHRVVKQLVPVLLVPGDLECVQEAQPAPVQVGGRGVPLELHIVHQVVVPQVEGAGGGLVVGVAVGHVPLVAVRLVGDRAEVDDLVSEGGASPLLHAEEALNPRVQACAGWA